MSHNLNSLRGVIEGTTLGVIKRDTRSLDYGSHWGKIGIIWFIMVYYSTLWYVVKCYSIL